MSRDAPLTDADLDRIEAAIELVLPGEPVEPEEIAASVAEVREHRAANPTYEQVRAYLQVLKASWQALPEMVRDAIEHIERHGPEPAPLDTGRVESLVSRLHTQEVRDHDTIAEAVAFVDGGASLGEHSALGGGVMVDGRPYLSYTRDGWTLPEGELADAMRKNAASART